MEKFETIVIGLGAMGSSTVYQMAKRGNKVLGVDQFNPPHTLGSTHGDTRITRLAIGEGEQYTPLAIRSHELWREIEIEAKTNFLITNGGLIISSGGEIAVNHVENFFENTVAAAKKYKIPHEILNAEEIRSRFPQFNIQGNEIGYFEPSAGFLHPEKCVQAQLGLAKKYGAEIHTEEKVIEFEAVGNRVSVKTDKETYTTDKLIITAGPWLPELLEDKYSHYFKIIRQVLFWFDIRKSMSAFLPENCPVFIWELQGNKQAIYGFPAVDGPNGGVKIASEQYETTTTPNSVDRNVSAEEVKTMYENFVAPYLPALSSKCVKAVSCLYTVTPDSGFVIDIHPEMRNVIVASPCSGHGFKHSAAIGEAVSQLIVDGESKIDLSSFRFGRFANI